MVRRIGLLRAILLFLGAFAAIVPAAPRAWAATAPSPHADTVALYFFWGEGCPHCAAAKPFLADVAKEHPELQVSALEVYNDEANMDAFVAMARTFGFEPTGVPTFFLGEEYWVGFAEDTTGRQIEAAVEACIASGCPDAGAGVLAPAAGAAAATTSPPPAGTGASADRADPGTTALGQDVVTLPLLGPVDLAGQSLLVSTALIAVVDGFNPCSLWVLSVLIALTLRTGSRRRVVLMGLVFISVTAFVYALFIAGLFTVLTVASVGPWVQSLVALVALGFAFVNIKDYFWWQQGVSFTIAEEDKPGIYRRIRGLAKAGDSLPALIGGTVVLAAGVSLVEFTCTAGFPVLWTNILTAQEATAATFLALLIVYLLIYQLDEAAIFGTAVVTLRASKLQERHGRMLKLVGGMLMLTLAVVMLTNPALMNGVGTSLLVFAAALAATGLVLLVHRVVLPRLGVTIGTEDLGRTARSDPRR